MLTKEKLKEQLENFPEKFSIDELIERLLLVEKVELGLNQSEKAGVMSDSDLNKEVDKWFE